MLRSQNHSYKNIIGERAKRADTIRGNSIEISLYFIYWRASVASETLTGVTQLKIGDVYLYICLDVRMSFCTLTLAFLC